jgi:hypothetical protein
VLLSIGLAEHEAGRVGQPRIVELNLIETCQRCLSRDGDVVGANLGVVRIGPCQALSVPVERTVPAMYREILSCRREWIVLERNDARDGVDATLT